MSDTGALAQISRARQFLADAKDLTDIKAVRDMAEAARLYARAAGLGQEAMNEAAEIKLRAERKAGDALAEMDKAKGAATPQRDSLPESRPPRLADIGITPKQSMNWQAEATVPEPVFEKYVTETKEAGQPLTTSGLVRIAKDPPTEEAPRRSVYTTAEPERVTVADVVAEGFVLGPRGMEPIKKAWYAATKPGMYRRLEPDAVVGWVDPVQLANGIDLLERSVAYLNQLVEAARRAAGRTRLEVVE